MNLQNMNNKQQFQRKSISGGMSRKSISGGMSRKSIKNIDRKKSISTRSFRPGQEEMDDLPNDKEQLTQILDAKTKHLQRMKNLLQNTETDALENEMILDENDLTNNLLQLQQRNDELDNEIRDFPNKHSYKKQKLKQEIHSYETKLYEKKYEFEQRYRKEMNKFEKELALENANDEEQDVLVLVQQIKNLKIENKHLKNK